MKNRIMIDKFHSKAVVTASLALLIMLFAPLMTAFATGEKICTVNCTGITTQREIIARNEKTSTTLHQKTPQIINLSSTESEISPAETLPEEYRDFIDSLPDSVLSALPDGVTQGDCDSLDGSVREISGVGYLLSRLSDAFGIALSESMPTLVSLCGIIILSAVAQAFSSSLGAGNGAAVTFAARLCSYSAIAVLSVDIAGRMQEYFSNLLAAVGAFLPLYATLYAMGGNLTGAVSGSAALSATLSLCEVFLCGSVVPVFCICLSLTLLHAFDGGGALAAQSVSTTIKKWYTTALGFVMTLLTTALASQSIISTKADNAAMRGVKFAAGSFIPVSGGAISSTLSTLAASVELLRGALGVVGIVVILLMLLPTVVELAVLRGVVSFASFVAGVLGCGGEQKLLNEVGSLYGYLEGIAALSAAVFLIAFGIFATTAAAV